MAVYAASTSTLVIVSFVGSLVHDSVSRSHALEIEMGRNLTLVTLNWPTQYIYIQNKTEKNKRCLLLWHMWLSNNQQNHCQDLISTIGDLQCVSLMCPCGETQTMFHVVESCPWQNWMAAYLGYTLWMKTLFHGWPVMVHERIREEAVLLLLSLSLLLFFVYLCCVL